ncbi:nucleoside hydrolase [Acetobacter farinalis]|uniref:Nucleoside hydrolase n=1 Tax=Acetobacter farinalis TaxID=1260984 RepID=A0ABT3Q8M6_9PROT|nr:nucleoside hydrolase [Acetobacter farinalis]MCX2561638.1 nucleoside hydrolase [Acetobacter farinalis]NHO30135.1 nucleoside hydrolase [Acetobacter farinalis]
MRPRSLPRRPFLRLTTALAATLAVLCATPPVRAQDKAETPELVIEDNDFLGPGGSDIQSTIPLLANPHIKVLGFTVSTGDDWENAESAHLRRFLEIAHREDIPVADGAVYPLINSVALMRLHEQQYGTIPWKGAWGGLGSMANVPSTQPPLPKLAEGTPKTPAIAEPAALFLIRMVHAHPHQVTIFEAGPMTNLALAIRLDPTFAATAKQLVFMGGLIDTNMMSIIGNADFASDFNMIFDPEAAHITLTAPWPAITVVGNLSNDIMMTKPYMARIANKATPVTRYMSQYMAPLPLWDEMAAAIAADPSLVQQSVKAYMDVETTKGFSYGHAHVWPKDLVPVGMGVREVTLVQKIDTTKFLENFVKQAQGL